MTPAGKHNWGPQKLKNSGNELEEVLEDKRRVPKNEPKTNSNRVHNARIECRIRALFTSHSFRAWPGAGERRRDRNCPTRGNAADREQTQNRGNEAKEYLKTKDITFLNAANDARFAHKSAVI